MCAYPRAGKGCRHHVIMHVQVCVTCMPLAAVMFAYAPSLPFDLYLLIAVNLALVLFDADARIAPRRH